MTLPSEVKKLLMEEFGGAFSASLTMELGKGMPTVAIVDFMMFVKYIPPEGVHIRSQLIDYFVSRTIQVLIVHPSIETLIILVDGKPLDAKRAVAHKKRHLEHGIQPLPTDGGPYLPRRDQDAIMQAEHWTAFSKNYLLLRRELYPLLFNAFMSLPISKLRTFQRIVLSGFPGRSAWQTVHASAPWEAPRDDQNRQYVVQHWENLPITEALEREDPDLYHRAYVLEHRPEGMVQYEWIAGKSDISEADIRMFWFAHFYPRHHILFHLNDGDVFSIGLLYAQERLKAIAPTERTYVYENWHTVMLPNKSTEEGRPKYTYVDLNKFYALVREYPPMREAGVQNHAATLVALISMAGCDFFNKFLHEMGFKKIIWKTFFNYIALFPKMFMMSEFIPAPAPGTRSYRTIVIDEEAFAKYVRLCFSTKYNKDLTRKKLKRAPKVSDIKIRAGKTAQGIARDDIRFAFPTENETRAYGRAVLWVLEYWKNGVMGFLPNCMELYYGMPYYPFWINPATKEPEFITLVCPRSKPIDEVFTQAQKDVVVGKKEMKALHQFYQDFIVNREKVEVNCKVIPWCDSQRG